MACELVSSEQSENARRPRLCGYLTIHQDIGLLRTYKTRWFIYSAETGLLSYYKSPDDLIALGNISISQASFSFHVDDKPGVFDIRTEGKVVTLEAVDIADMMRWLQELQVKRKETSLRQTIKVASRCSVDSSTDDFVRITADDIPEIKVAEELNSQLGDKSSSSSFTKLSSNVSKAADNARSRLSVLFSRRSNPDTSNCENCSTLYADLQEAQDDRRMARDELQAMQQVVQMLHKRMDSLFQEIHALESLHGVKDNQELFDRISAEKERASLLQKIKDLENMEQSLRSHCKYLEATVEDLKQQCTMYVETVQSKDQMIIGMSEQLQGRANTGTRIPLVTSEKTITDLQDRVNCFELQNQFLNKEILELQALRMVDSVQWEELNRKHIKLEANFYHLDSLYHILLDQVNQPKQGSKDNNEMSDDLMAKLLQEAMLTEPEKVRDGIRENITRESLTNSLRCKTYDDYGFLVDDWSENLLSRAARLQDKSDQLEASLQKETELVSHRVKWENFMANISGKDVARSLELKNLIRTGIPAEHRHRVWNILINFHVRKIRLEKGEGYYERLLKKHENKKHNPVVKQIELDLLRTLPNNKNFESSNAEGTLKLRRVLLAYSYHNPSIGYCQGMNRAAAFAILFLREEEDAFWCLVAIIDSIMPEDYFSTTMAAAQADQRVLKDLLNDKVPQVFQHLKALDMDISLFSFNWFLTIFIDNIPVPTTLRIWDTFLCEGVKILFRFAIAFFKYAESELLMRKDYIPANQYLRELGHRMTKTDEICRIALYDVNPFSMRTIREKRAAYLSQVKAELLELQASREEYRLQRSQVITASDDCDDDL